MRTGTHSNRSYSETNFILFHPNSEYWQGEPTIIQLFRVLFCSYWCVRMLFCLSSNSIRLLSNHIFLVKYGKQKAENDKNAVTICGWPCVRLFHRRFGFFFVCSFARSIYDSRKHYFNYITRHAFAYDAHKHTVYIKENGSISSRHLNWNWIFIFFSWNRFIFFSSLI